MLFQATTVLAAAVFFLAGHGMANPVGHTGIRDLDDVNIATDPNSACNCPNNCGHRPGSSCRYYSGPSDKSPVIKGHCASINGKLVCRGD